MAIDFPNSPVAGTVFGAWRFDGTKWGAVSGVSGGGSAGDITAVLAGTGLSGGGTEGDVSLALAVPVSVANGGTGAVTAPAALTSLGAAPAAALNDVGRNLIHNSLFNIAQRGRGPWTTNGYTADRWSTGFVGGTMSVQVSAMTDANRTTIGDDAAVNQLALTVAGGSGANDTSYTDQYIEDLHRTGGKTVTLSFWAAASAGTPKIGLALFQNFGSGGSPSGLVAVTPQAVTISTTFTRYTLTFVVPTIVGKTFGTSNNDDLIVRFAFSAGATASAVYGGIGVQSAIFALWGVQLEIGSTMTPLEKPDPQQDLAKCQRFYMNNAFNIGTVSSIGGAYVNAWFPQTMRATPTVTLANLTYSNASGATVAGMQPTGILINMTTTPNLGQIVNGSYLASADL